MKPILCLVACLVAGAMLLSTGCKTTPETPDASKHPAATSKSKPPLTTLQDQNGDQAFLAFLGRLRQAIRAHDVETIASMMTTDFGYSFSQTDDGKGVFAYWDQNNVWPELELIMKERFVPKGAVYMVAPAEYAADPDNYTGYRAGLRLINGSWRFAFFVTGTDEAPADTSETTR